MQRSQNDEVIGKLFVALSQNMRQCLICDGVFTTQGAAEHARGVCHIPRKHVLDGDSANW